MSLTCGPLGVSETASAQEATSAKLKRCVYLQDRIDRYTQLRRAGGSAVRMEGWRKSRERHAEEYRELRCHRLGRKIRRIQEDSRRARDGHLTLGQRPPLPVIAGA